jgi:hypothetical protein
MSSIVLNLDFIVFAKQVQLCQLVQFIYVLSQAKKGEPESTPNEILSMVKTLASPPHRILLFLQQSSVEWCSSLWLDSIREIDPTFKRTIIVVSKFDNRLKVRISMENQVICCYYPRSG